MCPCMHIQSFLQIFETSGKENSAYLHILHPNKAASYFFFTPEWDKIDYFVNGYHTVLSGVVECWGLK